MSVNAPPRLASSWASTSPSRSVTTTSGRTPMRRRRDTEEPDATFVPSTPSLLTSSSRDAAFPKTVHTGPTLEPASSSDTRSLPRVAEMSTLTQYSSSSRE